MDWNTLRNKRTSVSSVSGLPKLQQQQARSRFSVANSYCGNGDVYGINCRVTENKASHYLSQHPLFCADWISGPNSDLVALSSFREGFQNRIQIVHGSKQAYLSSTDESLGVNDHDESSGRSYNGEYASGSFDSQGGYGSGAAVAAAAAVGVHNTHNHQSTAFNFSLAAEAPADYPVTRLQWEPHGHERLAVSSEVLRLYKYSSEYGENALIQTHLLANNSNTGITSTSSGTDTHEINAFPPVTSFDWNATDPSVLITSSVDTTCTVWDLGRAAPIVKTQLIAHDSEVFDVSFLSSSTQVFASVSNDGSMRVFDLRSLEHSTIVYEPSAHDATNKAPSPITGSPYSSQALLRLSASKVNQHHLATVGVHSNQVHVIDLRSPGMPVATVDASCGGQSPAAVNSIQWHPSANLLATGGDDCQALVWDFNSASQSRSTVEGRVVIDTPSLAYSEELEVNTVCWRREKENWLGVVSGKGFQALEVE